MPARAKCSTAGSGEQGRTARAAYSTKFYDDIIARIQREKDKEDANVLKPSYGDRLLASRKQGYDHSDLGAVQGVDKLIEKR